MILGILTPLLISMSPNQMIQDLRTWESEQTRTPADESINSSLQELEWEDGSNETPKSEKLLQFPSDGDKPSTGRRHDRCHHRSWIRFIQERTGKSCWSGHPREENKKP